MDKEYNLDREVLFYRYASGMAGPEEIKAVEQITGTSAEAARELEAVREAIRIQEQMQELESYTIAGGYSEVRRKIRHRRRKHILRIVSKIAAIAAIPLLISTLLLGSMAFDKPEADPVTWVEIASAPGLVTCFELPDRSRVWLNSGSVLKYPTRFTSAVREVELDGEGYFEVESDQAHPFYVNTRSGLQVMAHGTAFNVNITQTTVETILSEGKVDILYGNRSLQQLLPGEQAIFDSENHKLSIYEVSVYEKTAWKDGKIIFRNAPLSDVFKQLSRRYNVDIVLHDEHRLADRYQSRVTFTDETIQQIFTYLEVAAPIRWQLSRPEQEKDSTLARQRIDVWLINK